MPEDLEKVLVWYEYFRYGEYNCMFETYGIGWQLSWILERRCERSKGTLYRMEEHFRNRTSLNKKKQITGVEPAFPAWEASVLPMNHICM